VANPSRQPETSPSRAKAAVTTEKSTRNRPRGRPPVISTERLLQVAREVFLELGIRATTSEVASRAGIAEGTIFHRFKSKEELFRAAMNFDPDGALGIVEGLAASGGRGDLRQNLIEVAVRFLEFGRIAMPVMMMSWSNPESQLCLERSAERRSRYERMIGALSGFFAAEMSVGRLRRADPEVMSRMLIGTLHHFCMTELFMGQSVSKLTPHEFAQHVVDVLLASSKPGDQTPPGDHQARGNAG
jgi:AcrR family transcriptional regulator